MSQTLSQFKPLLVPKTLTTDSFQASVSQTIMPSAFPGEACKQVSHETIYRSLAVPNRRRKARCAGRSHRIRPICANSRVTAR
jgi:hypothetical protein